MQKSIIKITAMLLLVGFVFTVKAEQDVRLLRFPDINKDLVAFVYAGDIWTVSANGGDAQRLTSHLGMELFPKISPDGQWIAFSGEYSGTRQVYVIPATGGTPKQLTFYNSVGEMPPRGGWDNVVLDWTPDSKQILVRMNRTPFGQRNGKYYLVSIDGGFEKPLQLTDAGFGVFSPDAKKLAFAHISREFRTWKRYKGGRAADIWIYDLEKDEAEKITNWKGTDQIPTWYGNKIYYASDESETLNIYSYDVNSKAIEQITQYDEFDVMWPSGENGMLAYENGGFIHKLNLETGNTEKLTVNISFDNPNIIPYYKNVKDDINSFDVSPTAKRAIFDARGDIYSVPAENGEIINLTNTQGVREIFPSWSPNGKYIAYVSDATGEYEIYLLENKVGAKPKQMTFNSSAWKYALNWSPNSKYIAYSDRTLKLKYLDIETKVVRNIDAATENEIRTYNFSPDSKWITYTKDSDNHQSAIWVYNFETGENGQITSDAFNDFSPVFSKCGNYMFFLSNRNFNLAFSSFDFDYLYNNATRIFAVALSDKSPQIFKHKTDVEPVKEEKAEESKSDKKNSKSKKIESKEEEKGVKIQFEGLANRIIPMPMNSGRYRNLQAVEDGFIFISGNDLNKYKLGDDEAKQIAGNIRFAAVANDGKKMLYGFGSDFGIGNVAPGLKPEKGKLDLSKMEMKIDPRKEWNQIYIDGWRIFRDYFYVKNLHGIDWKGLMDQYAQLLPSLSHRADLDYVFGEIFGETNTGHTYVNYGDFKRVERRETGLLGAVLTPDYDAGRYIISKIYHGENWTPNRVSPLTKQGIYVKEGDYLISINGQDVTTKDNPYKFLENTIGKVIDLTVNSKATTAGAKTYKVEPISSELELMYLDWVESRRKMVDELSGGRIGYMHLPNTAFEGNRELHRGLYTYQNKEALILDERNNGGGFIPWLMADLLDRTIMSRWHRRDLRPGTYPNVAHEGPKVMLINSYAASGGDALPYYFRQLGLGIIIGTRTWGGLVGISLNAGLVDGGYISIPRFGIFDETGWIIEGIGIYPDIEVVDAPDLTAKGIDPSVEKAVEVLLKQLEENPVKKVEIPANPDRSGFHEAEIK